MNITFRGVVRPGRLLLQTGRGVVLLAVAALFSQSSNAASVSTDRADYEPGAIVYISGAGFGANDAVTLQVLHADGRIDLDADHAPWTVSAGPSGSFTTSWIVDYPDDTGSTFVLTATGQPSGLRATAVFADAAPPAG